MAYILNIETAGPICSVALFNHGKLVVCKEDSESNRHSEVLNVLIGDVLKEAQISLNEISALALSIGPGSYTGLRIGAATAKALAYVNQIPVLGYSCLETMVYAISNPTKPILTTLNSRKNEVYAALYNTECQNIIPPGPITMDELQNQLPQEKTLAIGTGNDKLEPLNIKNLEIIPETTPSASFGGLLLQQMFEKQQFLDLANFEPNYMKKVHTTTPKKIL